MCSGVLEVSRYRIGGGTRKNGMSREQCPLGDGGASATSQNWGERLGLATGAQETEFPFCHHLVTEWSSPHPPTNMHMS